MRVNERIGIASRPFPLLSILVFSIILIVIIECILTRTAISTNNVLLVPYEAHHVARYHGWMQDPDIQKATASEPLTLDEEFENQLSWRTSHDKLTFILCEPLTASHIPFDGASSGPSHIIKARVHDSAPRTKGDVNIFLYCDDDNNEIHNSSEERQEMLLRGEVDVMVAEKDARAKGMGSASVRALITFVKRHLKDILDECARGARASYNRRGDQKSDMIQTFRLTSLMAKIKQDNVGSRALFEKLGFEQQGGVDYFGEVKMVMAWDAVESEGRWDEELGYQEVIYEE